MIQIQLGPDREVDPATDPLGRTRIGARPDMTEQQAWEAGRGVWKLRVARAIAEHEVQIIDGSGVILAVAEITGLMKCGDRQALQGTLLLGDPRVGQPSPYPAASRNPVSYH
ncbi:hypothetical protein [uncultured Corynebacterium sp.]|uniref:hypothetical protein n=1 Tax=uncultured Corynebacterium sp. TaxID=159447 RepID=UPI0015BFF90A|nr:hypothetical protein [uncultured Corynebacterium sp.]